MNAPSQLKTTPSQHVSSLPSKNFDSCPKYSLPSSFSHLSPDEAPIQSIQHYVGGHIAIIATPEDEDFNSSDVEILEISTSKSRQIGKASLEIILAHAEEDRILRKRREKTLSYYAPAPTTQQMVDFASELTVSYSPKPTSTGAHLIRFFDTMSRRLSGRGPSGRLSLTTLRGGLKHLTHWYAFPFNGWHLSSTEQVRLRRVSIPRASQIRTLNG
ncbi:hypothetical protein EDB81DRAFT_924773 [Dactylonectria macrodidyma]|uniref:Uncharacterized protein n=1 Tax=Dactylonectria macrodidyma TaxID=307937 RepID=A0A9P9FGI0_9HYPO|nr:hypothetical protein EDB81DRAFT_924773 [Dactylonectria macrodidyma]